MRLPAFLGLLLVNAATSGLILAQTPSQIPGKGPKGQSPPSQSAMMLPDHIGSFAKLAPGTATKGRKGAPEAVKISDPELFAEYGLDATEQAAYASPGKQRFTLTAWRLKDSTGGLALFQAMRPPAATPSKLAKLAVKTSDGVLLAYDNYVFQFAGTVPLGADLEPLYAGLPKLEESPLPVLSYLLPTDGLVPNSERYVLGPVSLARFEPRVPPSVAAFHLGSEGEIGKYKVGNDLVTLAIFNYPTPGMARQQSEGFQKIEGAIVKRAGPLVALSISPPDVDAAERILGQVRYNSNFTLSEKVPTNEIKGMATLLLNIFTMAGFLVVFSVLVGVGFGGFRVLARRVRGQREPDPMILLHLRDK